MPFIETPQDLAEELANWLGIYEDVRCHSLPDTQDIYGDREHAEDCNCRVFWVPLMINRIRKAVQNEMEMDARCSDGATC